MSRILIAGGAGYIGSALVPALLKRNHSVTVVDTFWFGDQLNNCKKIHEDASTMTEAEMKRHDIVIFLAGMSNDPMAEFAPFDNYIHNAALPGWLAWLAAKSKIKRFIHGGSCSVYGRCGRAVEGISPKTFSPYGVSKYMAEIGVAQQAGNGMEIINMRMGTVCGFSPRMRFDLIINAMVKDALMYRKIVVNDPVAERPILDIRDAVRAYSLAIDEDLELPKSKHITVNLVSENVIVLDIAKMIQSRIKNRFGFSPVIELRNITDVRSYVASGDGAKIWLKFVPEFKASDTIDYVISRFNKSHNPEADIFHNIRMLKKLMGEEPDQKTVEKYKTAATSRSISPVRKQKVLAGSAGR